MATFEQQPDLTNKTQKQKDFIEHQYDSFDFKGKKYSPFIPLIVIDKQRQKRNEEWLDRMADMMIVRRYASHVTEGRVLPKNFGYIDVNCFGDQLTNALRYDKKKDLPLLVLFR